MPLLLAGAAWALLQSRRDEPPRTRYVTHENLVQSLLFGESVATTARLGFGSPRGQRQTLEADPRLRSLATGLLTRGGGKPPFAFVVGRTAAFDLDVLVPTDRRLTLRLSSAFIGRPQELELRFNGQLLGGASLRPDGEFMPVHLDVPAALQVRGRNRVELLFSDTDHVQLHDLPYPLPLAARLVSCHFLRPGEPEEAPVRAAPLPRPEVVGQPGAAGETRRVIVPAGVSTRVASALPDVPRLVLRFQAQRVDTALEVSLLEDGGRRTVLATIDREDGLPRELLHDLSPWAGQTVQFDFWAEDGQGQAELAGLALLVPAGDVAATPAGATGADAPAGASPSSTAAPDAPPSFLVVVLDALARERSSAYGAREPTTPVLQALARNALVARDLTAPASYTVASVGSLFTGQHPLTHGVMHGETLAGPERLAEDAPHLALELSRAGYRTGAFITNPNAAARHGFGAGFDLYDELFADPALWQDDRGVDGSALPPRLQAFLAQEPTRPFLAWVHLFEPHAPWEAPAALREQWVPGGYAGPASGERAFLDAVRLGHVDPATLTAADRRHLERLYAARLAQADARLGELLDVLERSGRRRDTVVLVTSDHGEAILEHGRLEHGDDVHREQLDVPFVLLVPGRDGGRLDGPASLIDVAPTLLGLAGLPVPSAMEGRDLLATGAGAERTRISRGYGSRPVLGIQRGRWKATFDCLTRRQALYDLVADPGETRDVWRSHPATASLLHADLCRAVAAASTRLRAAVAAGEVDAARLEQLSQLGYVNVEGAVGGDDPLLAALRAGLLRD